MGIQGSMRLVGKPTAAKGLKKWLRLQMVGHPLLFQAPHRPKVALAGRIAKKILAGCKAAAPSWRRERGNDCSAKPHTYPYPPPFFNSKNGPRAAQEKFQEYVAINSEEIIDFGN